MKNIISIIQESILDISIQPVVENGIFDPSNDEHIFALIENLEIKNINETVICEAVAAIRQEGKYPDRQAYNKEGWLVTFPSPQYKQAAIKKGTHFASDPTHGKGGMNVYYKRKGKQKRMTQQDQSQVEQPKQQVSPQTQPQNQPQPQPPRQNNPQQSEPDNSGTTLPKSGNEDSDTIDFASQYEKDPDTLPKSDSAEPESSDSTNKNGQGENPPSDAPPPPPPPPAPVSPPPPSFVNISVEFAKSKQWNPTPYGEWRTDMGDTAAIVALSGEVVPVKSNDREELKLLATKRQK